MVTRLVDVRMYIRTSPAAVRLTSAVSLVFFDSLEPSACSASRLAHSTVHSTRPYHHWSSLRCHLHMLPTPPRVALRVLQVRCLWRFRRANYLHHVGALARIWQSSV